MRQGTIITDSLSVRAEPGGKILGSLHRGERVYVRNGPIIRERTWWQVESLDGSTHLTGWVAEGAGGTVWLSIDPVEEAPPPYDVRAGGEPPPRPLPSELSNSDEPTSWMAWVASGFIAALGLAFLYFFTS